MTSSYSCTCQSGSYCHSDPNWRPPLCSDCRARAIAACPNCGHAPTAYEHDEDYRRIIAGYADQLAASWPVDKLGQQVRQHLSYCVGDLEALSGIQSLSSVVVSEGVVAGVKPVSEVKELPPAEEPRKINFREWL